jgi:hypothetical protein
MSMEFTLISLFFVLFCMSILNYFSIWDIIPSFIFRSRTVLFRNVLNRDILLINIEKLKLNREQKFREKLYQGYFE